MVAVFERLQITFVAPLKWAYHTLLSKVDKVHHFCFILTIRLLNSCVVETLHFSWHIETQEDYFALTIFSMYDDR